MNRPYKFLSASLARLMTVPIGERVPRAVSYLRRQVIRHVHRLRDATRCTYLPQTPAGSLCSYMSTPDTALLTHRFEAIAGVAECFLAHRFDYLGSGWVQVRHGLRCSGVGGYRYDMGGDVSADARGDWLIGRINRHNLREAQRLWSMVDAGYVPIDWQLDFKSGYRWSETTWSQDVLFGHRPGVDIKVPWELSRMQHLPQLAIAYGCARANKVAGSGFRHPEVYAREFRNQALDFLATNPPGFGVNWRSAMDVGIRAANLAVAFDLFRTAGATFEDVFEKVLCRSLTEHGHFIVEHFGWEHIPRSNHYFAHLTGLLFIGAYLPRGSLADAWLAFGIQELLAETLRQFHADGTNFEGSTGYHRLSGEMLVYATALVMGLPLDKREALEHYDHRLVAARPGLQAAPLRVDRFPSYSERIERLAEFVVHTTKPSGQAVQIGDNDSGRFLRLMPVFERLTEAQARTRYAHLTPSAFATVSEWWDEQILDYRHLVAAAAGLVDRPDLVAFGDCLFETAVVSGVAGGLRFPSYRATGGTGAEAVLIRNKGRWPSSGMRYQRRLDYAGKDLRHGLKLFAYPDFGLYIFRSDRLYLAIRCGSIGQDGNGGHAHNDQLAVELEVDGAPIFSDPGSFIYTALPVERDRYRSDNAHTGFRSPHRESARLDAGLFMLRGDPKARCLYFEGTFFVGQHTGYGFPVIRRLEVQAGSVLIDDLVVATRAEELALGVVPFYETVSSGRGDLCMSVGYGKLVNSHSDVGAVWLQQA